MCNVRFLFAVPVVMLSVFVLAAPSPAAAQTGLSASLATSAHSLENDGLSQAPQTSAVLRGHALDARQDPIPNAVVTLTDSATGTSKTASTDSEGAFVFADLPPASYNLSIMREGFSPVSRSAIVLAAGQDFDIGLIRLDVASVTAGVQVVASQDEIAVEQVKLEEKQRLFGILPNYFVAYFPHPAPLSAGQKMRLALRTAIDPTVFCRECRYCRG